ncbi:DUF6056 family protein [Salmonella enterica]|uniref:DUF6056 family protein n=1 Tax=Salmonella enterica TaxID=28901 RepID=UPI00077DFF68|nr:DUF6056 family protein [Salmonella enterica]EEF0819686.1 hypothetical protein [Salmonella enterica subsp. enterica serovar Heidelberg]EBL0201820.1 hypothetical protein [Salmonella enterica]KYJ19377.1 hypothetical protein AIZ06_22395 [Salmonella enterica subsp. enterica serovar Typhimurium]KYJ20855.1 hypothetical protein AIZ05_23590 [Salmonella enterica subsp. enterica serovar Typhimurium]KYJ21180.1 hypothetical protein AIZ03_22365 [Salmonella enterica subsp. enterica serovar Typhimurium]
MINNRLKMAIAIFIVFSLVYSIGFITPMNSDDYTYALRELSFSGVKMHYLGWSGRIVSDTISTSLLKFFSPHIYNAINSAALTLMVLCWAIIPAKLTRSSPSPYVMIFLFFLYFIANPAFGQTNFWLVGSANYLWTNMFIAIYILISICVSNGNRSNLMLFVYVASSILAGCSNENTSLVVVLISVAYFFIMNRNKYLLIGVLGSAIGAGVLLLAPGNLSRASTIQDWYNQPLAWRILEHFSARLPSAMGSYWQVYIAFIILLISVVLSRNSSSKLMFGSFLFMLGAVAANVAFLASPAMPSRALNGALCFMILSTSFIAHSAFTKFNKTSIYLSVTVYAMAFLYFIPSYILYHSSIKSISKQTEIREEIINRAKDNKQEQAIIPDYYFPPVLHAGPSLDTFNSEAMSRYYGIGLKITPPGFFDYSKAFNSKPLSINAKICDDVYIKALWIYKQQIGIKTFVIFEFNKNPADSIDDNTAMFIHINNKDGKSINADVDKKTYYIDGRWFSGRAINNIDVNSIKSITSGTWDVHTGQRKTEYLSLIEQ